MKNLMLPSCIVLASLSIGSAAVACDMHGAGFSGYGMRNAQWQAYNPRVSTMDPAFAEESLNASTPGKALPSAKARPTFSNAANNAAAKAKTRLAKKDDSDKKATPKKKPT